MQCNGALSRRKGSSGDACCAASECMLAAKRVSAKRGCLVLPTVSLRDSSSRSSSGRNAVVSPHIALLVIHAQHGG